MSARPVKSGGVLKILPFIWLYWNCLLCSLTHCDCGSSLKLALRNALRYFPPALHVTLAPEFAQELRQHGHIYMYRFCPTLRMRWGQPNQSDESASAGIPFVSNNSSENPKIFQKTKYFTKHKDRTKEIPRHNIHFTQYISDYWRNGTVFVVSGQNPSPSVVVFCEMLLYFDPQGHRIYEYFNNNPSNLANGLRER